MDQFNVSHREIYDRMVVVEQKVDRMVAVEQKVDRIDRATADVVSAFTAAQGAFTTLEWLGKLTKPIIWLGGVIAAIGVFWHNFKLK